MAEQKGLSIPDAYIKEAAYRNADEAYERTRELLALDDRPTCILYQDDFASFGGIKAIRQAGLKIPQDISVAGYDGIRIAYQLEPQLTTLKQDTDSIGRLAAEQSDQSDRGTKDDADPSIHCRRLCGKRTVRKGHQSYLVHNYSGDDYCG